MNRWDEFKDGLMITIELVKDFWKDPWMAAGEAAGLLTFVFFPILAIGLSITWIVTTVTKAG